MVTTSLLLFLLSGCASFPTDVPEVSPGPSSSPIERDRYHVRIPTHDGIELEATVYQPDLAPGETAPLIIATHGFGGFRAERPFSLYGKRMITGQAALKAWEQGYWVVFYDQRGWGDSQGVSHGMSLDHEVKDVSTVIDWSLNHIPAMANLPNGKPAIGMIGESYGAGAQLLASFFDDRATAMVPIAGWHDLGSAVAPHNHMKSNWGAAFLFGGAFSSGFDVGFMLKKPMRSGFSGTLNNEAVSILRSRSPIAFCEQGIAPKTDVLLIQGFRDNLFPVNEAINNFECWNEHGRDARLLAIQGAHKLLWPMQKTTPGPGVPLFDTDEEFQCGEYEARLDDTIVAWWDEKLKGTASDVPKECYTLGYDHIGLESESVFRQDNERFDVPKSKLHIPFAGLFEGFMIPFDVGSDIFRGFWTGADLRDKRPNGGFGRPKFIPLYIAHEDEVLSGVPELSLKLGGSASKFSTRVFVGVGVQHAGKRRVHVASEQLFPLPKKGHYVEQLPAVSMPLKAGDRVGLVVYGYTWQYFFNPSYWWSQAQVSGSLSLPIREMDLKPQRRR